MSENLISIIIPTYNRAYLLGETLDSIIAQTYTCWECIVVDDGSEDYTYELMQSYTALDERIKYFQRPVGRLKGANSCRNFGYEISKGEYINWFDSDDLMHPKKLELQVQKMKEKHLDFVVCHSLVFESDIKNIIGLRHPNIFSDNLFDDYVLKKIFLGTIAPLWRKNFLIFFNKIFDEELKAGQEWEFFSRLLAKTEKGMAIERPLVYIRQHPENITNRKESSFTKWNYFLARHKIYRNQEIEKNNRVKRYLEKYMLYYFKNVTIERHFSYSIAAYRMFIGPSKNICMTDKIYGLLAILSYMISNKGYFLLSKINLRE